MSYSASGSLATYNSLQDRYLAGYFGNTKMKKHLKKSGLVTKEGRVIEDNTYRLKMAKKEHRKHVRDMLATAIVHKALDMERMHQYEMKKKLEELYKVELVQRIRAERAKKGEDDVFNLVPSKNQRDVHRASSSRSKNHVESQSTSTLPDIHYDKSQKRLHYQEKSSKRDPGEGVKHREQPTQKILQPHPPVKKKKRKSMPHRGLMLARTESAIAQRIQLQSLAEVTVKYIGSNLNLNSDNICRNNLDEVTVYQQHCGGSTLCVFKELLSSGTQFSFISRRHRGSPFGLTFYIDGLQDCRLSSCCEYKHKPGHKIGGKNGRFLIVEISGAAPCYKCQVSIALAESRKKKTEKKNQEEASSESDEEGPQMSYDIIVSVLKNQGENDKVTPEENTDEDEKNDLKKQNADEENVENEESKEINDNEGEGENEAGTQHYEKYDEDAFDKDSDEEKEKSPYHSDSESVVSSVSSSSSNSDSESKSESESERESESENEKETERKENEDDKMTQSETDEPDIKEVSDIKPDKEKLDDYYSTASEDKDEGKEFSNITTHDSDRDDDVAIVNENGSDKNERMLKNADEEGGQEENEGNISVQEDIQEEYDQAKDLASNNTNDTEENNVVEEAVVLTRDDNGNIEETKVLISEPDPDRKTEEDGDYSDKQTEETLKSISPNQVDNDTRDTEKGEEENADIQEDNELPSLSYPPADTTNNINENKTEADLKTSETDNILVEDDKGIPDENVDSDSSDEVKERRESSSSSSSSSSDEEEPNPIKEDESDLDTTVFDKGHDPDSVRENDTTQYAMPEQEPAVKHDGSILSLLESTSDLELSNIALSDDQIEELAGVFQQYDISSASFRNTCLNDVAIGSLFRNPANITTLKMLNLNLNNIGPEGAEKIADCIRANRDLQVLMLHGNPLKDEGAEAIISALQDSPSIASLDLGGCQLKEAGIKSIATLLESTSSLAELNLTGGEIPLEGWQDFSKSLASCRTLSNLSLDYNKLGDDGISILADPGFATCSSLKSIDLEGNGITDKGAEIISAVLEKNKSIIDITLTPRNEVSRDMLDRIRSILMDRLS